MIKKLALITIAMILGLIGAGGALYLGNRAPTVPAISTADAADQTKPFVVKLHAQWCAVCLMTTSVWSDIQKEYEGRVNFLVLDFTDDQTTEASREAAARVGLRPVFDQAGATGVVLIVDGRTREVMASIGGSRDVGEYRSAIDAAMARTK